MSVHGGHPASPANARKQSIGDPRVVVEILSPSRARHDQTAKLEEYRALPGVRQIVSADPATARVRLVARGNDGTWVDRRLAHSADVPLASLGLAIPRRDLRRRLTPQPAAPPRVVARMNPDDPHVPATSVLFGYGPMLPLVAGGVAAWLLPGVLPVVAVQLTALWGGLILVFVAGVRRGFGFGSPRASTVVEIATMLVYFLLGLGGILLAPRPVAVGLLMTGYALVALLDRRAALAGNAPAHFARLRPPQMLLGLVGLALAFARTVA